jgi:hypothetical protein
MRRLMPSPGGPDESPRDGALSLQAMVRALSIVCAPCLINALDDDYIVDPRQLWYSPRTKGRGARMNLDHIFSLITFATGALFYVVLMTTLRRRLKRCMVVPKNGITGGGPTGPVRGWASRMKGQERRTKHASDPRRTLMSTCGRGHYCE